MKRLLILTVFLYSFLFSHAQYSLQTPSGSSYIEDVQDMRIGMVTSLSGAYLVYSSSATTVEFYKYDEFGATLPVPSSDIQTSQSGNTTTYHVYNLEDSKGYYAKADLITEKAIWIIDYLQHKPILHSISAKSDSDDEDKCYYLKLLINKDDRLFYYTPSRTQKELGRKYTISYDDLKWDGNTNSFITQINSTTKEIGVETNISQPLKNTIFTLSGDHFAEKLNLSPSSVSSEVYTAIATEAHIEMEIDSTQISNNAGDSDIYPAPFEVELYGHGNEPTTTYYTWFIYNEKVDPDNYMLRYTDKNITYTFTAAGNYRIILETASEGSACVSTDSIKFSISESRLDVPNFFTPDASPGVNDEFKVVHRSLLKFKCTIFNRWGNKLYEFSDPDKGWDGKYKGKFVDTGVYFYVIEALGADGKKYKKAGDINILRSK
ncbi:gliding motility-associated-like protein [Dysgonomonas sp. PH5-45]|uniref:T9SS type B sorting domain-containing protein n=1 Tax=unclassified Dysgonomonas TaxID=2630389 RepID=UPI002474DFC9|nr:MULTISPECIES: gliding motility-associated C-terminal domain-containing protein [unclassified Dysgonomonas]MDH6354335.1 gliding motility-associated-like protein [Dysgonomonas sp. PH5-45]MDH6387235.1 gliding motility-associated-like protein [Dysgonomonas sp. PH5-37]